MAFGFLAYVSHPRLIEVVVGGSGAPRQSVSPAKPTPPEATAVTLARPERSDPGPGAIPTDSSESQPIGPPAPAHRLARSQGEAEPVPTTPGARVERATVERPRPRSLSADEQRLLDGAEDGDLRQVTGLLAQGVSPDPRDDHGLTPLMLAVIQGHGAVALALLERGASTRLRDRGGITPLMFAAINDRLDLLQSLLAHRATVDARSVAGWTALTYATWEGHTSIARRLLGAGADPEQPIDGDGRRRATRRGAPARHRVPPRAKIPATSAATRRSSPSLTRRTGCADRGPCPQWSRGRAEPSVPGGRPPPREHRPGL